VRNRIWTAISVQHPGIGLARSQSFWHEVRLCTVAVYVPHGLAGEYFLALILIYPIHTNAPITHTHGVRKNNGTLHHRSADTIRIESERIEFQRTREVRAQSFR